MDEPKLVVGEAVPVFSDMEHPFDLKSQRVETMPQAVKLQAPQEQWLRTMDLDLHQVDGEVVAVSNVICYRDLHFDWNCQLVATLGSADHGHDFRIHCVNLTRPGTRTVPLEFALVLDIALKNVETGQRLRLIERTTGRRQLSWVVHGFNWNRIAFDLDEPGLLLAGSIDFSSNLRYLDSVDKLCVRQKRTLLLRETSQECDTCFVFTGNDESEHTKRMVWAHSSVLKEVDYFRLLFEGGFAESKMDNRLHTAICEGKRTAGPLEMGPCQCRLLPRPAHIVRITDNIPEAYEELLRYLYGTPPQYLAKQGRWRVSLSPKGQLCISKKQAASVALQAVASQTIPSRRVITQALAVLVDKIGYVDLKEFLIYRYHPRAMKTMILSADTDTRFFDYGGPYIDARVRPRYIIEGTMGLDYETDASVFEGPHAKELFPLNDGSCDLERCTAFLSGHWRVSFTLVEKRWPVVNLHPIIIKPINMSKMTAIKVDGPYKGRLSNEEEIAASNACRHEFTVVTRNGADGLPLEQRVTVKEPLRVSVLLKLRDYLRRRFSLLDDRGDTWLQHGSLEQTCPNISMPA